MGHVDANNRLNSLLRIDFMNIYRLNIILAYTICD
jgi:hypothetical protein